MLPDFDDNGYLPPGIHPATMDDVAERFGTNSELRRVQIESLCWMLELAWRAGVKRVVINGSFVTDFVEPNDVDCVLLIGSDFPKNASAEAELLSGLPFLEINLVGEDDFSLLVDTFFATDRRATRKGMVEIIQ